MNVQAWTFVLVAFSFAIYIGVAVWSRARSTGDFYIAAAKVPPVVNGMATAADWMSAASFISMAGLIAFMGRDGSVYLMGWTGGYVLLALLLAPYLRKFGKYTVPDFVGVATTHKPRESWPSSAPSSSLSPTWRARCEASGSFSPVSSAWTSASSFFPAILLGIFTKRMNHYGAVSGMIAGIGFTLGCIVYFKLLHPELNNVDHWWLGVSPEGIGTLGMVINFVVAGAVARFTPPPPPEVQKLVEEIRVPRGAGVGHELAA